MKLSSTDKARENRANKAGVVHKVHYIKTHVYSEADLWKLFVCLCIHRSLGHTHRYNLNDRATSLVGTHDMIKNGNWMKHAFYAA